MRVLIACEFSGIVRDAFIAKGHDAMSCDLLPTEQPGPHYQGDVFDVIDDGWALMIAFPPCTHLACSGARHFKKKIADGRQQEGVDFFLRLTRTNIPLWAIENPVGIMSKLYRHPDQIIQPFYFGDEFQKTTCLWLNGLPFLYHNKVHYVDRGEFVVTPSGKKMPKWYSDNKNPKERSRTFTGIANAMAAQWG